MRRKSRILEVKNAKGKVIVSIQLNGGEGLFIEEYLDTKTEQKSESNGKKPRANSCPNDGSLMTDAQKRLLFRLLADKGLEGDKAYDHLKYIFQVDTLKEVTKYEVSLTIKRLLEEAKGGSKDDNSPF